MPPTIAVVGGGNTAMDVARSLLRLGVKPLVVYRRTRSEMPAIPSEVDEAIREGICFHFLAAPRAVIFEGDAITALECVKMRLGEPDDSGRRAPVPIPESEFRIAASGIVSAIGETIDLGFFPEALQDGWIGKNEGQFAGSLGTYCPASSRCASARARRQ